MGGGASCDLGQLGTQVSRLGHLSADLLPITASQPSASIATTNLRPDQLVLNNSWQFMDVFYYDIVCRLSGFMDTFIVSYLFYYTRLSGDLESLM